jgi:hypothetical protein
MARREDINYLHDCMAKLDQKLDDVEIILAKQEENLKLHMKRSDHLEEIVTILRQDVWMVRGVGAFLAIAGIMASIYQILHKG